MVGSSTLGPIVYVLRETPRGFQHYLQVKMNSQPTAIGTILTLCNIVAFKLLSLMPCSLVDTRGPLRGTYIIVGTCRFA